MDNLYLVNVAKKTLDTFSSHELWYFLETRASRGADVAKKIYVFFEADTFATGPLAALEVIDIPEDA
jgi:hypothetical protein